MINDINKALSQCEGLTVLVAYSDGEAAYFRFTNGSTITIKSNQKNDMNSLWDWLKGDV